MIQRRLLPAPTGVDANNTATFDLRTALNKSLFYIELVISEADGLDVLQGGVIGEIRVIVNEGIQRRMTLVELNNENARRGAQYALRTTGAGANKKTYIKIFFFEPWLKGSGAAARLAWHLKGAASARIEIDIKDVETPNLSGFYGWMPPQGVWGGLITKWIRKSFQAVGDDNDYTMAAGDFYHSINLYPIGAVYVKKARLMQDGDIKHDLIDTLSNQVNLLDLDFNPDVSANPQYTLQLDAEDPINGALPTQGGGDLDLHLEFSDAANGNMIAIIQQTGVPDNANV